MTDRPNPPRFLADVMLGSLARWLRILGLDTLYDNQLEDDRIARVAVREDRVVLTRDVRLTERKVLRERSLLIASNDLEQQLLQVLAAYGISIDESPLLVRCLECNQPLKGVSRDAVRGRVPAYVFANRSEFKECPACRRLYWKGTHRSDIVDRLRRLTDDGKSQSQP